MSAYAGLPVPHRNWINQSSNSLLMLGDFNCNYNTYPYEVNPDTEIIIRGRYPFARYLAFTGVGQNDISITSARDSELIPDPGSTNPFLPGADWNAEKRNYTLKVRFTAPPQGSGHYIPGAGNNVFYLGTLPDGSPNAFGTIGIRIYVPSIGYDDTGGVGLPLITYAYSNAQQDRSYQSAPRGFDDADTFQINRDNTDFSETCDLVWSRIGRATDLIQPAPNMVYITADVRRDPDKLLFVRWKAPAFPDTYHNIGIDGTEDMRYWSMNFVTRVGLLGLFSLADFQAIIDKDGYVNWVISFGAPRPPCVTTENGFTWSDASQLPLVPLTLLHRNNVPSEAFPFTAKNVEPGAVVPPEVMGEYYPCGKHVDPSFFDSYPCDDESEE